MFRDEHAAERIISRLQKKCHRSVGEFVKSLFENQVFADDGFARFARIVEAQSTPGNLISAMETNPLMARIAANLICYSPQLSNLLVQNPEMMSVLLNPQQMERQLDVSEVVAEGERLLLNSISYAHKLDRIRYLKQLVTVKIAAVDLANLLPQEQIWKSLNDLAEGVLTLMRAVVWEEIIQKAGIESDCPVAIIGMGKFGGQEINYSSDLDLVFVIRDDADEQLEKHGLKFAERLRAALADHMGRGDLYRVDLRLRPFGSQGPMVSRIKSVENYYQNYAEPWEHLAMIRSRIVGDVNGIAKRWESLRTAIVFRGARSEGVLESLQKMRIRIDSLTTPQDLKRGPGGIRDVEFLTQTFQMLAGHRAETLRIKGTIPAINALKDARLLPPDAAADLIESYRFLRQLEHRCQIIGGLQTHELPQDYESRLLIANSLGMAGVNALMTTIDHHRSRTRRWYEEGYRFSPASQEEGNPIVRDWLSALPGQDEFLASLARNQESEKMANRIVHFAPALIPYLKSSVFLTEQVLSGEILDENSASDRFDGFAKNWDTQQFAKSVRNGWVLECIRFVLAGEDLGRGLSAHFDAAIESLRTHFCPEVDLVALGSYAANHLNPDSDLDLIAFVSNESERERNEKGVLDLMRFVKELKNLSAPIDLDFRLRPEGRKGRLTVSEQGFQNYADQSMETWERFALARSRGIGNLNFGERLCRAAAYSPPLSQDQFLNLNKMKSRIEQERVNPLVRGRNLKLGTGTLDDITWSVQIQLFSAKVMDAPASLLPRIALLQSLDFLTPEQGDLLSRAHAHLSQLRARLFFIGVPDVILPEDPAKLKIVAEGMGFESHEALKAEYSELTQAVRLILEESWEMALSL